MSAELLIEANAVEVRAALVRDGRLADLAVEPASTASLVGSVWLGRVRRLLPNGRAAFVDIGQAQAGFLNAADIPGHAERPIAQLVHEGQALVVQVTKDAMAEKGASLTADITLPGRFLVMTPGAHGATVSRRIADAGERDRLSATLRDLEPGCIVRTAAAGRDAAVLHAEHQALAARWAGIEARRTRAEAPALLWREESAIHRILRDLSAPADRIVVDPPVAMAEAQAWARAMAPDVLPRLAAHAGAGLPFDVHDLDAEIARLLAERVVLPSGAALRFGTTAALTAIDVDSAGSRAPALAINLEAAVEIARQLRLRGIGGVIVIDFMRLRARDEAARVTDALRAALADDPAPARVLDISELGLVEMTRRRLGEPLGVRLGGAAAAIADLCRAVRRAARVTPGRPFHAVLPPAALAALPPGLAAQLAAELGAAVDLAAAP